jgi:hypothetical protein
MNTITNTTGDSAPSLEAAASIVTTQMGADQNSEGDTIIQLGRVPSIAPEGLCAGRFTSPKTHRLTVKGVERRMLRTFIALDAMDDDGKPFVLHRDYNLDGHGIAAFSAHIKAWRGTGLTRDEINSFNTTQILVNKPVMVEIGHREIGNKTVAYIKSFKPAPAPVMAN